MYELNIPLTEEEAAQYLRESTERLADMIRSSPRAYSDRNVQIEEGQIESAEPRTQMPTR